MPGFEVAADSITAFIWTCLIIELTPGPNMTYLAVLSMQEGRHAGLAAVAGVAIGLTLLGMAAALGLATVIENSRFAYEVLRWAGVGYLLWLALESWRKEPNTATPAGAAEAPLRPDLAPSAALKYFRDGVVTNVLNPKAALFYIAVLPGFIDANRAIPSQTATLMTVYVSVATAVHVVVVLLGAQANTLIAAPTRNLVVRRLASLLLVAVAAWLAWSTRR